MGERAVGPGPDMSGKAHWPPDGTSGGFFGEAGRMMSRMDDEAGRHPSRRPEKPMRNTDDGPRYGSRGQTTKPPNNKQ